jgi:hypothetical protein
MEVTTDLTGGLDLWPTCPPCCVFSWLSYATSSVKLSDNYFCVPFILVL